MHLLITSGPGAERAAERAAELRQQLESGGHQVTVEQSAPELVRPVARRDAVITVAPALAQVYAAWRHARAGAAWIVDLPQGPGLGNGWRGQPAERGLRWADAVTCASEADRDRIYEEHGLSAAVVAPGDPAPLQRLLGGLASEASADHLRILMLGPVNSPHMEDLALELKRRGHSVRVGGVHWGGGLAASSLPDAGIPLSTMTRPAPVWLRRVVRRAAPDLIHANWLPFAGAAALAGASPLVAMAWGSDVFHPGPADRLLNAAAVHRAKLVLADSEALLGRLVEIGADPARAAVVNWGVDIDVFRPPASPDEQAALRRSLGLEDAPTVISARGFSPIYNTPVILEAFSRLIEEVPNVQLILKHGGGEEPSLGPLGGSSRVRLIGRVPYDRMAELLRAADVCVSVPSTDSSPRSVWEAMACGCACVISDLPWAHELIRPGVEALVVPIDAGAVAGALGEALSSDARRKGIAAAARALVVAHRDRRREMDRLERLYAGLVDPPASVRA